ncbi:DUF2927 domain-containing protein [Methylophilus medardicus]|uniref:DUF2927 domain-containing protein n=2 Tax=Methylophilus medardicus TaxID=2588534 RepID=A0A5B8CTI4_9PROT|nr:DUF2927 domain-containing protein [Methylophilus medardicus]QDC49546.1 DUF2927 domain-containing protein [Methylophilus medardicus]QDC53251.1 DUF2927 domain-containing protein [Methylophilus medardicus]
MINLRHGGWMLMLTTSLACAEEPWQSPAYLQQAFVEVALRNEYVAGEQTVRKWQQPIKVWLVQHDADQSEKTAWLTRAHLQHLSQLTGLPINMAIHAAEANMTVVFSQAAQWRQDIAQVSGNAKLQPPDDAVCMFGLSLDTHKAIKRAWVVIPVDHAQEHRSLVSCIVEEITQAMGLPNDSEHVYPSVFNDKTPESLLTGLDALLLKMLYLPAIKPGMRAAQIQPILAGQLQQWQLDGTIQHAEQQVRQSALYEMMGF